MLLKSIAAGVLLTLSLNAFAKDDAPCIIMIDRTPCPGKKVTAEAMEQYQFKNPKAKPSTAKTKEECIADAKKFAVIDRVQLFTKKVATATFNGEQVAVETGTANECKPEPK